MCISVCVLKRGNYNQNPLTQINFSNNSFFIGLDKYEGYAYRSQLGQNSRLWNFGKLASPHSLSPKNPSKKEKSIHLIFCNLNLKVKNQITLKKRKEGVLRQLCFICSHFILIFSFFLPNSTFSLHFLTQNMCITLKIQNFHFFPQKRNSPKFCFSISLLIICHLIYLILSSFIGNILQLSLRE